MYFKCQTWFIDALKRSIAGSPIEICTKILVPGIIDDSSNAQKTANIAQTCIYRVRRMLPSLIVAEFCRHLPRRPSSPGFPGLFGFRLWRRNQNLVELYYISRSASGRRKENVEKLSSSQTGPSQGYCLAPPFPVRHPNVGQGKCCHEGIRLFLHKLHAISFGGASSDSSHLCRWHCIHRI